MKDPHVFHASEAVSQVSEPSETHSGARPQIKNLKEGFLVAQRKAISCGHLDE